MKLRFGFLAAAAFAFLLAGGGCADTKVAAERESLVSQNKDLMQQLEAEKKARSDADARASAMTGQMAASPTPDSSAPPSMGSELDLSGPPLRPAAGGARSGRTSNAPSGLGENVSSSTNGAGEVVLEIPGDVLFDSGKATIKASAQKSLDTIAATIKRQYANQTLRIEGHTDASPVKNTGWDDNYDLGSARANAVLHYLAKKGVPEKNMYIASFAANNPKSTKTPSLNRRVDIVVVKNAR